MKKKVLVQEIEKGGLKMPNITLTTKAIKISWVKRIISKDNNFTKLALINSGIKNKNHFFKYKINQAFLSDTVSADIYKQVIGFWYDLYCIVPKLQEDALNECLWNNAKIL